MPNAVPAPSVVSQPYIKSSICYLEGGGDVWVIKDPNLAVSFHSMLKENSWLILTLLFIYFARDSEESNDVAIFRRHIVLFKSEPLVVADVLHRLESNACLVVNRE